MCGAACGCCGTTRCGPRTTTTPSWMCRSIALREHAQFVEGCAQLPCVPVDAKGPGADQLVLSVAAAQQPDAQHPRTPCGEEVPYGVPDDVALLRRGSESRGAREEEVRLRLGALDVPTLDDHRLLADAESLERLIDLGPASRGRDPMGHPESTELREQLCGFRERTPLGEELSEELSVARLHRLDLVRRQRSTDLARHRAREETSAHSHSAVYAPAIDRQLDLCKGALPGEDVRVDRVDERPVQVEDQRRHSTSLVPGIARGRIVLDP